MQQEDRSAKLVEDQPPGNLPYLKPDDVQYFDKLLVSWKSPRLYRCRHTSSSSHTFYWKKELLVDTFFKILLIIFRTVCILLVEFLCWWLEGGKRVYNNGYKVKNTQEYFVLFGKNNYITDFWICLNCAVSHLASWYQQVDVDESTLSPEELKERKIMKLLLKIKNGTPPMRKAALRQITDKAREFGAGPLFNQILPLLMSPTLEDQVT